MDVEVTYRNYSGSYQPTEREFLPVAQCQENVDAAAALPEPITRFLVVGHNFFFLKLKTEFVQCSDGRWNFCLLKRPCPAKSPRCEMPHLWISHEGTRYRTQENTDTVDHQSMRITKSRKEEPLVLPGRVYDLTFSLDDVWNSCGCDTVDMAISYKSCHSMSASRVISFKIMRHSDWWDRVQAVYPNTKK